jgi:hypothetical protein
MQTTAGRDGARPGCGWDNEPLSLQYPIAGEWSHGEHGVSWGTAAGAVICFGKHFGGLPGSLAWLGLAWVGSGWLGWEVWQFVAQSRYRHRRRKGFPRVVSAGFQPILRGSACLWGASQGAERSVHLEAGPDGGRVGDRFRRCGRGGDHGGKVVDG